MDILSVELGDFPLHPIKGLHSPLEIEVDKLSTFFNAYSLFRLGGWSLLSS